MNANLRARLQRQHEFFVEGKGNLMVFAMFSEDRHTDPYEIPGQGDRLCEEFIAKNAYEMGIQLVRNVKAQVRNQVVVKDDSVPSPCFSLLTIDWGVGATAALFSGGDAIFEKGTSYSTGPVISDWSELDSLVLSTDNRWFDYELEFWRGVLSEYEEGLPIVTHNYRTPLDYANDYRGNELFMDLYDHPDEVHRLLAMCTDAIIECDRRCREELPELKNLPGGAWGVGLPQPGMLFLNGDPIDLVSVEHGEEFNTPYVERLIDYAGSLYYHHHSIGASRARSVGSIKGLTVQEILQDPNGPRLCDCIDDDLVAASRSVPIDLHVALNHEEADFDEMLEKLVQGRFIVRVKTETREEARRLIEKIRRY